MSLLAGLLRAAGLTLTLYAVSSCSGEMIRLGDASPAAAGAGSSSTGGGAGAAAEPAGAAGESTCPHGLVRPDEVLWIGDSWVTIPNATQTNHLAELARAAGALGPDESYPNLAAPATTMAAIASQYEKRQSGPTKVKVLLMDGGTWDPIAAQTTGASVDVAIEGALADFEQFLTDVAADGTVEHIVYFLVPELDGIPGVATMRPRLQQACAASTVPCHFLDLQPLWQGHPEYVAMGIQASVTGATVLADNIWSIMHQNCIAQ